MVVATGRTDRGFCCMDRVPEHLFPRTRPGSLPQVVATGRSCAAASHGGEPGHCGGTRSPQALDSRLRGNDGSTAMPVSAPRNSLKNQEKSAASAALFPSLDLHCLR
jgi:hypothetical protein